MGSEMFKTMQDQNIYCLDIEDTRPVDLCKLVGRFEGNTNLKHKMIIEEYRYPFLQVIPVEATGDLSSRVTTDYSSILFMTITTVMSQTLKKIVPIDIYLITPNA